MISILLLLLIIGVVFYITWVNFKLNSEMKRNRILQAFVAGLIRVISDYHSKTDQLDDDDVPDHASQLPIPYKTVLENIDWELSKDMLLVNYEKWLKQDRNIFYDDKRYSGDGFNFIYMDLFDNKLRRWFSNELLSPKKKEWLSEDTTITKDNVDELETEIAMLRDLVKGKLDDSMFTPDNIDAKFALRFSHIRLDKLLVAKITILSRRSGSADQNTTQ